MNLVQILQYDFNYSQQQAQEKVDSSFSRTDQTKHEQIENALSKLYERGLFSLEVMDAIIDLSAQDKQDSQLIEALGDRLIQQSDNQNLDSHSSSTIMSIIKNVHSQLMVDAESSVSLDRIIEEAISTTNEQVSTIPRSDKGERVTGCEQIFSNLYSFLGDSSLAVTNHANYIKARIELFKERGGTSQHRQQTRLVDWLFKWEHQTDNFKKDIAAVLKGAQKDLQKLALNDTMLALAYLGLKIRCYEFDPENNSHLKPFYNELVAGSLALHNVSQSQQAMALTALQPIMNNPSNSQKLKDLNQSVINQPVEPFWPNKSPREVMAPGNNQPYHINLYDTSIEQELYDQLLEKTCQLGNAVSERHEGFARKLSYHYFYGISERIKQAALNFYKQKGKKRREAAEYSSFFRHINEVRALPTLQEYLRERSFGGMVDDKYICIDIANMVRRNLHKNSCPVDVESIINDLYQAFFRVCQSSP